MESGDYCQVDVWCGTCDAGLRNQTEAATGHHGKPPSLRVEVCPKCAHRIDKAAYKRGLLDRVGLMGEEEKAALREALGD